MHGILLTIAALILTACGGSSPSQSAPTTPTSPSPPTSATTNWMVTHSFASVSGADNCWVRFQRQRLTGVVFRDLDMTVIRSGGEITIQSQWFNSYIGTFSAGQFTARQNAPLEGGTHDCGGGNIIVQQSGVSNLSGRFAPDDQTLSATESNVYPLNTGETVTYTWNWEARRR